MGQIITWNELGGFVENWRREQQRVVLTNGCFDLLHAGHLRVFKEAKRLGDLLVVGINSDQSIRKLKGEKRPIVSEADRSELVAALEPVDFVTVFPESTADELIRRVRPHVYVKGGDYNIHTLPERATLKECQVELAVIPLVFGLSTSMLIEKIKGVYS
jgi:rfaE bifunctional protein nucleotidyltransferase chain/domain